MSIHTGARPAFAFSLQNSKEMDPNASQKDKSQGKGYVKYQVDKYNSYLVLVVYEHAQPDYGRNYYSLFIGKDRTEDEQIDAMISLIIRKRFVAKVMILYRNLKRGTGKTSDLPENQELIRIHHGSKLDFSFTVLDIGSQQFLKTRLSPLQQ
jgi:hypothetical protein